MKVLTIVYDLGAGGTQRNAQNFSLGFKDRGQEVAVLAYQGGGPRLPELESNGIPVFVGGAAKRDFQEAVDAAISWRPDVLHIHSHGREQPEISAVIRQFKSAVNRRLPIIERNVFAVPSSYVNYVDVHWLLSRWDVWQWTFHTSGISPKPLCVAGANISRAGDFYRPSNADRIAFRVSHNIPVDAFVFGRIGQPYPLKWSPIIFDAFGSIAREEEKAYLLLVGLPPDLGVYLANLPSAIRRRIIEVPFLHSDEELRACYGAIDIFVHASEIGENCGNVLNEAMLCECPVITLSTPYSNNSQVEQVLHNECGFVVGRVQDFASAMTTLMNDQSLRMRFAREGRRSVLSRFSTDSVMNLLIKVVDISLSSASREDLYLRLQREKDLITNIPVKDIVASYKNSFGKPSALVTMLIWLRLVRSPLIRSIWPRLARKAFMMGI
ncbi:MAG: glycosyltransferase family 4 protein [Syntrophales bacterium]